MTKKNKTVIVTGAGRGIGRGIALAFAQEKYNVVVSDINLADCKKVAKEIEENNSKALAVKCDVSSSKDVEMLISKTAKKFNQVDVLINNAGIFPFQPFAKMAETQWDKVINVNLKSIFLCSKKVLPKMPSGGRIINISSIAAFVGFEGLTHYCASKGAINAMIRSLALELASKKINVNAIAPGAIDTPGATGALDEKARKENIANIPMKRFGSPEDIANAVVFLASEKSNYITGQTIIVDGGWTLK